MTFDMASAVQLKSEKLKFILHTHGDAKIKLEVAFVAKILIVEDNVDTNEALSEYLHISILFIDNFTGKV